MKASKFSDAQKAFIVKRGEEGVPVAEICREAGISQATYFNWRKDCNEHRPHGAIGNKVPVDLMKSEAAASPCS